MFPSNDNDWIKYIIDAEADNENPCWVDIVGNADFPATYYYLYPPAPDPTTDQAAFRMRLNGNPLKNNPTVTELDEFVWGVDIKDAANNLLFRIQVNASGNQYNVQVIKAPSTLVYNAPIVLGSNVRVITADSDFPCAKKADPDYFLDFEVPVNSTIFGTFNFKTSTYRFCYFTSTQDNVINKEYLCGPVINPGQVPVLCVDKQITGGPKTVCAFEKAMWTMRITVNNCGTVPVENVSLKDIIDDGIVLTAPTIVTPSAGTINKPTDYTFKWAIGDMQPGETQYVDITITGYFSTCGHKTLDTAQIFTGPGSTLYGTVSDEGIFVNPVNPLTLSKTIVSGPTTVERCQIATWQIKLTVANSSQCDVSNVVVRDTLGSALVLEQPLQLNTATGSAVFNPPVITWTIDTLGAGTSADLNITATGFFSEEGSQLLDEASAIAPCQSLLTVSLNVDVKPISIPGKINVSGNIVECKTKEPVYLDDVTATVYDNSCRVIKIVEFDGRYDFELDSGIYIIKFSKKGYTDKFLVLILLSGVEVIHDICMIRKCIRPFDTGCYDKIDIFVDVVKERIDADIIYNDISCIMSKGVIECGNDVIDSIRNDVVCNSKLFVNMNIEKNVIYKLNGVKNFKYSNRPVALCFPIGGDTEDTEFIYRIKVCRSSLCKDGNRIINSALIKYIAYFVDPQDVIVEGYVED